MNMTIVKVFLVVSLLLPWAPGYVVHAMRSAGKREGLETPASVKTARTDLMHFIWLFFYLLWVFMVSLFVFGQEGIHQFWKISILDTDFVKIVAMAITCLGYYVPTVVSVLTLYKSIHAVSNAREGKTALIKTGIYRYTRNPMYLSISVGVFATFLMMPSLFSLLISLGMISVFYAVCLDEEKRLMKLYGEEYEKYRNDIGILFPKVKSFFPK